MATNPFAGILTPALLIDLDAVDHNISTTIRLLGSDPVRWRPHVKTSKLEAAMRRLVAHGVTQAKCATTLELHTMLRAGITDALISYSVTDVAAARVRALAAEFPDARISALAERPTQIQLWEGSRVGLFLDVNSGMNRTGMPAEPLRVVRLAREIAERGIEFRGLHFYEGHLNQDELAERTRLAHAAYDKLLEIIAAFEHAGVAVPEVITSGTPALPCALAYKKFLGRAFRYQVSPGTIVYGDVRSQQQLPREWGLRCAVTVLSTVVSRPGDDIVTCDAGHKAVSADAGDPTCAVLDHDGLTPLHPSEEHLPIRIARGARAPEPGSLLRLLPRHVCPTVNNFDHAVMLRGGAVETVELVTARGHEPPLAIPRASSHSA
jgi:D-serine deaminase-like pyridoxal phosphate-dependent protein